MCTLSVLSYISIDKKNYKTKTAQGVWLVTGYSTVKTLMEQDLDNITVSDISAVPHLVFKDCCMHSERCSVCIVSVSTA